MSLRPTAFALCGLAAVGLAACDTADGPSAAPETATGVFDAALFPDADQLIATSNRPDALDKDRVVRYRSPDALDRGATFFRERDYDVVSFQQSKFVEQRSEYYATFDIATGTGGRIARFDQRGNQLAVNDDVLIDPKGFDYVATIGDVIVVADVASSAPLVFDATTLELLGPLDPGSAPAWDVHFDTVSGGTFVAQTNGTVAVYDPGLFFYEDFQVLDANGAPAINNHGITIDTDPFSLFASLVVSDVGSAASATDGALSVIDYDFSGDGSPRQARATYAGANTMLGNPVDIAGSGNDVFVAEKANGGGRVMRFANVLEATGTLDVAPATMAGLANPESVDTIAPPQEAGLPEPPVRQAEASKAFWKK